MQEINYRKATAEDAVMLSDLRLQFALELSGQQENASIDKLRKQLSEYFKTATSDGSCISYIAYSDDKAVGIGSVMLRNQPGNFKNPSGKWGYIMNMYTLSEFRRKGICKGILELLVSSGKEAGITAFELHATPVGAKVYEQEGFEIHSEPTYRKF